MVDVEIHDFMESAFRAPEAGKVAKMLLFSLTNDSW